MGSCRVFFFIDAMGAAVVRDQPVIRDLGPVFTPLRSVFGYSSACVPSILTGRLPQDHLHWSFFTYRGPGTGMKIPAWMKWLPASLRDRGRVRYQLSKAVKLANGYQGYFQMYLMPIDELHQYGTCETTDIFRPGGMNRGSNIADVLATRKTKAWVSDWHQPEGVNWANMRSAAADPATSFLFIYAASMDAWLHDHTRESPNLTTRLGEVRQQMDAVLAAARAHHDEVKFYVWSDHGMCTIRKHLDPFPALRATGLRMHHDYHCVVDSTMIRCWYPDAATRERVGNALASLPGLTRCTPEYLAAEGCAFPDRRFGDEIWRADPHLLIVPSHMGKVPLRGMHGYDCGHEDSDATFLTDDTTAHPRCITDLYRIMETAA